MLKFRRPKEKRRVPKTVQQSIPIDAIYKDGITRSGKLFSKTWRFSDINYKVASNADQEGMFKSHCSILNGLPIDATAKITIFNRRIKQDVFNQIMPENDNLAYVNYIVELNSLLKDKMEESNNIIHDKYITISSERKNIQDARTYFARVGSDLASDFSRVSSHITALDYNDRLRIFYDFFRGDEDGELNFNLKRAMAVGADFKDYICPDSIQFKSDHIMIAFNQPKGIM